MRKLYQYTFVILIMATLTSGGSTLATSRGISIISTEGQSLDLYRDYQAVVVGISNYDWWPKLRYAADDAKAVFITLGNYPGPRAKEVERGGDSTYDLSRFKKIVFYLKGRKKTNLRSETQPTPRQRCFLW